jgi:hypothetical protein
MAVVLEAIFGWLGFLGIGYMLRGQVLTGLALLITWWITIAVMAFLGLLSFGSGLACIGPIWFAVPLLSALALASRTRG